MNHKSALTATALAAALASPTVFANDSNLEGFHLGLQFNNTTSTTNYLGEGMLDREYQENYLNRIQTNPVVAINGKYQHQFGKYFVLGAGGTLNLSQSDSGAIVTHNKFAKIQHPGGWTLYIAPGIALTNSTLLYAKYGIASRPTTLLSDSFDLTGSTAGLGIQHMIDKHVYVAGELSTTDFSPHKGKNKFYQYEFKNSLRTLTLELGYKF